jgi:cellulose synthase/poly-beta-1,6-N-acetylglucosamine synthase-like glycosyltransferase
MSSKTPLSARSLKHPAIRVLPADDDRPLWSVMIPTYNARADYLEETLRSVLQQDPGPEQMQIEVVDDCSTGMDVASLVKAIAGERVQFSRTPRNLGLAGCWNACIERSRGQWVHILHQDDWVLPGFYARFEALIKTVQGIDAAFARHLHADADGHWTSIGPLVRRNTGEFRDFDIWTATWVPMQCAAVVVKRSTYEKLGGYRNDIPYVLDWEMWCRIAASGRWGYVAHPGAVYREHDQSETTRLRNSGEAHETLLKGGQIARSHFSSELQTQTKVGFRNAFVNNVLGDAIALYVEGNLKDAGRLLESFHGEAMKSNRRWDWLWLRLRVKIKPLRQLFGHA